MICKNCGIRMVVTNSIESDYSEEDFIGHIDYYQCPKCLYVKEDRWKEEL